MRAKDAARGPSGTRVSDSSARRGATVTCTGSISWKVAWRAAARRPETLAAHTRRNCTLINKDSVRDVRHALGS